MDSKRFTSTTKNKRSKIIGDVELFPNPSSNRSVSTDDRLPIAQFMRETGGVIGKQDHAQRKGRKFPRGFPTLSAASGFSHDALWRCGDMARVTVERRILGEVQKTIPLRHEKTEVFRTSFERGASPTPSGTCLRPVFGK
jgi:hypothetical protein